MFFCSVFLKMDKKAINRQKRPNLEFLTVNSFFYCIFKNTEQKNICASIVFKDESEQKHEDKFLLGVFLQKPKMCFLGGPK